MPILAVSLDTGSTESANVRYPRINRAKAGLLIIDIQDRLLPQIFEKERLVEKTLLMLKGAAVLRIPVLVTEQYRKGLGLTAPEIATAIADFSPIEKATF